jgi:polysaccharide deacetylase family protein (PEP-CTERM system associated)
MMKLNLLSFDLEDWFHILDINGPKESDWAALPSNIESNSENILELLSKNKVFATFFVLGWVARRYSAIVKKIDACGHEIACHGFSHDLICDLTPKQFRDDLRKAKHVLEDIVGKPVNGYRGPGFSITRQNLWAFDVIAEEGFTYDATVYPGSHAHGGISGLPTTPFRLATLEGHELEEFPVTVFSVGKHRVAFSGGGYFRLFPFAIITRLMDALNSRGIPVMVYLHPRDLDPLTPRIPMPLKRRFKCYVNLSGSYKKLQVMLGRHTFIPIRSYPEECRKDMSIVSVSDIRQTDTSRSH